MFEAAYCQISSLSASLSVHGKGVPDLWALSFAACSCALSRQQGHTRGLRRWPGGIVNHMHRGREKSPQNSHGKSRESGGDGQSSR